MIFSHKIVYYDKFLQKEMPYPILIINLIKYFLLEIIVQRVSPSDKAAITTISSVAFPNVAFKSPPTVSFVWMASCSVTKPSRSAKGAKASSDKTKVTVSGHGMSQEAIARGVHGKKYW